MSRQAHSRTPVDTSNPLRRKKEIVTKKINIPSSRTSSEPRQQSQSFGPYGRVRAKLARAFRMLNVDVELSLQGVLVNDLERAVSAFLQGARSGHPAEGFTSIQGTFWSPGSPETKAEPADPERQARVKANRKQWEVEMMSRMASRGVKQ